jgi:ribosome maturation factor RimP
VSSVELAAIFYVLDFVLPGSLNELACLLVYMTTKASLNQNLDALEAIASKAAIPMGLHVLSVKLGQQGKNALLEVCIYKKGGAIGLSDCETFSRAFEVLCESEAANLLPIQASYLLDVVSPGIDRQLTCQRDFDAFAGARVRVKSKEKIGELGDDFLATLVGGDNFQVSLAEAESITSRKSGTQRAATRKSAVQKPGAQNNGANQRGYQQSAAPSIEAKNENLVIELQKLFKINLYAGEC